MRIDVRGEFGPLGELGWKGAVRWYGEYLLGDRARRLSVFLELVPYLRGVAGSLGCTDWRRRRNFIIQIQTGCCGVRKQLYTLGHEMTHVRQAVDGELHVEFGEIVWRSDRYPGVPDPWEVEAYAAERPLYRLFRCERY